MPGQVVRMGKPPIPQAKKRKNVKPNQPYSIRRTFLYRFCVLNFFPFFTVFRIQNCFARFFDFLEGTVFVPYSCYKKVSQQYF